MNVAGWRDILESAKHNDFNAVKYFVEKKGAAITARNSEEQTAAHIAIEKDHYSMVKYLVDKDPSIVTMRDKMMRSLLIRAVEKNALDVVAYLIEDRGEDINKDHNLFYGSTVLHLAALHGHLELLKFFVEDCDIDCNFRNDFGETPLFFAVENVHMTVIRYLIEEQHAKISFTDRNNDHVLYISAWKGDLTVPRYLLDERKKRIDLNYKNNFGETLLHRAVKFDHLDFIKYLVQEKRVKINSADNEGRTPLHHAAAQGNFTIVKYLCDHGASYDVRNAKDQTVLEVANDTKIVKYLETLESKRTRRSAPSSFVIASLGDRQENVVTHVLRVSNDLTVLEEGHFLDVTKILSFVGLCLKYLTISGYVRASPLPLLTPSEVLRNRMDSDAVDAIEAVSGFELA
jgi:ankyrin repeat protein